MTKPNKHAYLNKCPHQHRCRPGSLLEDEATLGEQRTLPVNVFLVFFVEGYLSRDDSLFKAMRPRRTASSTRPAPPYE